MIGDLNLTIDHLTQRYLSGDSPVEIVNAIYDRIEASPLNPTWISIVPREAAVQRCAELAALGQSQLPLYGIPFAVKDNIDVAGMETTAGCPDFAYRAERSATVVEKLIAAGAILIGKTNMDQFATGLVGTRSPYGACSCVFNTVYISGGSSSGSAVTVASGLVSFSLGTDTAGSGRVPAAFNNIVGFKPTRGTVSASGVVPACKSLDCVSIFSLTCADALAVFDCICSADSADEFSRPFQDAAAPWTGTALKIGMPKINQQEFFGDDSAAQLYVDALKSISGWVAEIAEVDFTPFSECAALLYSGPWVTERAVAVGHFIESHPESVNPIVRSVISASNQFTAADSFKAQYALERLRKVVNKIFEHVDVLVLPTTGTIYTIDEVNADPIKLNSNLGHYTNFVNLLDLAAVAVPAGFRPNGLPFGVTLISKAFTERSLAALADRLHRRSAANLGATAITVDGTPAVALKSPLGCTLLAVVGAHLTGQPLNFQLTSRGARLWQQTKSSSHYRLFALPNTTPPKPGLFRDPEFVGTGIELEVWAVPTEKFGSFVADVSTPLGIGNVELADGSWVKGFICEQYACNGAKEITHLGAWRNYVAAVRLT